jgi:hypothetical protein
MSVSSSFWLLIGYAIPLHHNWDDRKIELYEFNPQWSQCLKQIMLAFVDSIFFGR